MKYNQYGMEIIIADNYLLISIFIYSDGINSKRVVLRRPSPVCLSDASKER